MTSLKFLGQGRNRAFLTITTKPRAVLIHLIQHVVRKQLIRLDKILPTQELISTEPLNVSVIVMHEHMRLRTPALFAPSKNRRREDRRHPPGSFVRVATWPVHKDHIPVNVVDVIRQVV